MEKIFMRVSPLRILRSPYSPTKMQMVLSNHTRRRDITTSWGGKKFANMFGGTIDAQVLMRTDLRKFSADFNASYIYDFGNSKIGYGGLTVRTSDAVALMFGYTPMENLTVGYSYDITVNKLSSISRGSHEIFFKFCYDLPEPPKQSARHPRWL